MKKLLALILAVLMLTACASGSSASPGSGKKPAQNASSKSFKSSVLGRKVSYNALTPAQGLTLPIPSEDIITMVQIENRLYFLGSDGVCSLDIETGESKKLFDSSALAIAAHGGKLYTYSLETSLLSEYDHLGGLLNETSFEISDVYKIEGLSVTDDYYIINCMFKGKFYAEPYLYIYSKETGELTLTKKMPIEGIDLYPYKGNKMLCRSTNNVFGYRYLSIFDAETGKKEELKIKEPQSIRFKIFDAVAYCPKTDTVVVYGRIKSYRGNQAVCITEYSLEDTDNVDLCRYYYDINPNTKLFVSVYENLICAVSDAENECRVYDYLNPPDSITLLGVDAIQDVIFGFEKETGIIVKTAGTEFDKLILKLLAKDNDFDIFCTAGAYHEYVDSGAYVDLKEIESLNSRISSNTAADFAASYNGKYFGMPSSISEYFTSEEWYPEDGSVISYSLVASENIYYAKYIDVADKRFSDPDGKELYKLYKFIRDNPGGNKKKMPFDDDLKVITNTGVFMLNPSSPNTDKAVKFLEYIFDVYNGDIPGIIPESDQYPEYDSTENLRLEWRCKPLDIVNPIIQTRNAIHDAENKPSNSELKRMAREDASDVAMRIGE